MTSCNLRQQLEKEFTVVGFVDLAELTKSPGAALKFFKSVFQTEFSNQSRIVIFSSQTNIEPEIISHLYRTANFVDISNWFVLLCTTNDISTLLLSVCNDSSTDPVPFQNLVVSIGQSSPLESKFALPSTICAIPWSNIEIKSTGDITPCCVSNYNIGHVSNTTLESAFYSDSMQNLRNNFLAGHKPPECNTCWNQEDRGLTSQRQNNFKRVYESFLLKQLENPVISTVDLKFQNTCNFKCRICGPDASSLFADEYRKIFNIQAEPSLKWSEDDHFIKQFNCLLPQITNIDIYGGEPFLIKKFSKVLEHAVDTGCAANIRLHYNSNGSVWPKEFIDFWPYFKQVDIHFSIDAIGERFNLQRGGKWTDVESNIVKIKNLNLSNMIISIMPTVSVMNVLYINEVFEWAALHNFQVFVNYVTKPQEFSISNLTPEAKELIYKTHKDSKWPEIKNIVNSLTSTPDTNGVSFCKTTAMFDSIRNENFADHHSEIAKAMGYVYNKQP